MDKAEYIRLGEDKAEYIRLGEDKEANEDECAEGCAELWDWFSSKLDKIASEQWMIEHAPGGSDQNANRSQ
jgi:hypothetical protein